MSEENCGNCKFVLKENKKDSTEPSPISRLFNYVDFFYCRRYPKTIYVGKYHWCGEWKEKND